MLIDTPIVAFYNCSMFCCGLLYGYSSLAIFLMGKRELVALLCLSSWFIVNVVWLSLTMSRICLQFVIEVFPDHTHLLLLLSGIFHFYSNLNRNLCKQTVETLIRHSRMGRLVWVCTTCLCPTKRSLGLYGLR